MPRLKSSGGKGFLFSIASSTLELLAVRFRADESSGALLTASAPLSSGQHKTGSLTGVIAISCWARAETVTTIGARPRAKPRKTGGLRRCTESLLRHRD